MVTMEDIVNELTAIVNEFAEKMGRIAENELTEKPLPNKWSKKEVIGHLIDSAQNNLRRFIVGQYETMPPKIVYDQNYWVKANDYQNMSGEEVIKLWRLVNMQIANVLKGMNKEGYDKTCDTSKELPQLHTLAWLADDYLKHLKHHLNQVIKGSYDIVYS